MTNPAKHILIIEDDPTSAAAFEKTARDLGAVPVIATTFNEGLELAQSADFDLMVIDRMLPGGDGIDAIAKLRLAGSSALVLVVSALGRAANKIEGLEKGADDYLAKPFDPNELRAASVDGYDQIFLLQDKQDRFLGGNISR